MVLAKRIIGISLALLALDQITKIVARALEPSNAFFDLAWNTGASFGIFPGNNSFFLTLSLIVLVLLVKPIRESTGNEQLALVFFWTGVLGNAIDRAVYGAVTDFINVLSFVNFPIFNVADALISLSAAYLAGATILASYHGWDFRKNGKNTRVKNTKK